MIMVIFVSCIAVVLMLTVCVTCMVCKRMRVRRCPNKNNKPEIKPKKSICKKKAAAQKAAPKDKDSIVHAEKYIIQNVPVAIKVEDNGIQYPMMGAQVVEEPKVNRAESNMIVADEVEKQRTMTYPIFG